MELKWEYALPTDERCPEYDYESSISAVGQYIYYVSTGVKCAFLHIINKKTGSGHTISLPYQNTLLPSKHFSLIWNDRCIFYTGDLFCIQNQEITKKLSLFEKGEVVSHLQGENRLFLTIMQNPQNASLCCIDLETLTVDWEIDISNSKNYVPGSPMLFENNVACYGKDLLLYIDPENGTILDTLKLPRIDKLFCPIRLDADTILLGYTNWTNAGVLQYNLSTKQIIWRHKRKFEGPQGHCQIYKEDNRVFWVKNGTELICLDAETGDELYAFRTSPWLYTDLRFYQNLIVYGTAGADGYFNALNIETGKMKWSAFLKDGCAYYDIHKDSVLVGDWTKTLKQFSIADGNLLQTYSLDAEVVGRILVSDGYIYTIAWGNETKGVRLIQVKI